ncbi:MAG TPA: anhydro-N-acetylmuramic acid kinase [Gammaproteobacteria bacterium]|nr:anhydro-N-acetylmuramic acid kinase [Gammaproteobacteria bacterium]
MARYFLGLISGTSVDGVDAALCDFGEHSCRIVAAKTFAYPPAIERRIQALIRAGEARLAEIGALDVAVGRFFADCALALIQSSRLDPEDVEAIGHHGQTIWHEPNPPEPFSWQLGDPNSVAAITGIDTVADLRRLDMAAGGQGAPIVPAFHAWAFGSDETPRVVLNIGGIANLTQLAPGRDVLGFDCGPGNTLLDGWTRARLGRPFDEGGRWAASGRPDEGLLEALLGEPYFSHPAPKSTGRELFNETWLKQKLGTIDREIADADVAATLMELTARTIVDAIAVLKLAGPQLIVCGGGAKNGALIARIGALAGRELVTTAELGIDPDWVEAAAMAWLARARLALAAGNVPTVTAAREARVLGGLYSGRRA